MISKPLELAPTTVLPTHENAVGLVIDVPPADVAPLVRILARRHARASFAFEHPTRPLARLLASGHDEMIVSLRPSGIDEWIGTADAVSDARTAEFVLAPRGGMSTGQYLLARLSGAHVIAPSHRLERGAIVVWNGGSLTRLLSTITQRGLRPTPLDTLTRENATAGPVPHTSGSTRHP